MASSLFDELDRLMRVTGEAYFLYHGGQSLSYPTGSPARHIIN